MLERENAELRFGLSVVHEALKLNAKATFALAAPEDRGALKGEHPGSIWQIRELRRWCKRHELRRAAVNQCELGPAESPAPLGVLTHAWTSGTSARSTPLRAGWPRHSPFPGRHYVGPLPRRCGCGTAHVLTPAEREKTSIFASQATARFLAALTLRPHVRERARRLGHLPGSGDFSAQPPSSTSDDGKLNAIRLLVSDTESDKTWSEPPSETEPEQKGQPHSGERPYHDAALSKNLELTEEVAALSKNLELTEEVAGIIARSDVGKTAIVEDHPGGPQETGDIENPMARSVAP